LRTVDYAEFKVHPSVGNVQHRRVCNIEELSSKLQFLELPEWKLVKFYSWIKHEIVLMQVEGNVAQSQMSGGDAVDVDEPLSAENDCAGIMETAFRKRTDIKMPMECDGWVEYTRIIDRERR
jgi:hypothetical protein